MAGGPGASGLGFKPQPLHICAGKSVGYFPFPDPAVREPTALGHPQGKWATIHKDIPTESMLATTAKRVMAANKQGSQMMQREGSPSNLLFFLLPRSRSFV